MAGTNIQDTLPPPASQDLASSWETKSQDDGQAGALEAGLGAQKRVPRLERVWLLGKSKVRRCPLRNVVTSPICRQTDCGGIILREDGDCGRVWGLRTDVVVVSCCRLAPGLGPTLMWSGDS